jgi:hypothetical protein
LSSTRMLFRTSAVPVVALAHHISLADVTLTNPLTHLHRLDRDTRGVDGSVFVRAISLHLPGLHVLVHSKWDRLNGSSKTIEASLVPPQPTAPSAGLPESNLLALCRFEPPGCRSFMSSSLWLLIFILNFTSLVSTIKSSTLHTSNV